MKRNMVRETWATIGGRIEDYKAMAETKGFLKTWYAIKRGYGKENAKEVFNGLIVFMLNGYETYYGI
jgi:hypothetical protein